MKHNLNEIDAIGIGFRRCASSFIHKCLNHHPDVKKPERGVHYFSEKYYKGIDWYIDQVPKKSYLGNEIIIESSVSYSYPNFSDISAKRIFEIFPNVKLFVGVRDPVERAFSDYLRSIRNLEIPNVSFEQAIEDYPIFIERGRYKKLLEPYFHYFPKEKIHFLIYDDLTDRPSEYQKLFYKFLGINEDFIFIDKNINENRGSLKLPKLQLLLLQSKSLLDRLAELMFIEKLWAKFKGRFIGQYNMIRNYNIKKVNISTHTKKKLYKYYSDDIKWLSKITSRNLKHWK